MHARILWKLYLKALGRELEMIAYIDSMWFIAAVLGIALFAWAVRSFVESNPDSFLLNFTFFAFTGQCVLTAQMLREGNSIRVMLGLLLIGLTLMLLQVVILRAQARKTLEHYRRVLDRNKAPNLSPAEVERWATMLLRATGVDFYPEFYWLMANRFGRGPRDKRREEAISILPHDQFRCGANGVTTDELIVPPEERQWLWRSYAFTCISVWIILITSIRIAAHIND